MRAIHALTTVALLNRRRRLRAPAVIAAGAWLAVWWYCSPAPALKAQVSSPDTQRLPPTMHAPSPFQTQPPLQMAPVWQVPTVSTPPQQAGPFHAPVDWAPSALEPYGAPQQGMLLSPLPAADDSPYRPITFFDPNIEATVPSVSDPPVETPIEAEQVAILPPPATPARGPYQQSLFTTTYVGGNDLGLTTLDMRSVFAFPLPDEDSPLLLTPGYGWTLVDGPSYADLPSQLHEAYLDVRYLKRFTPAFLLDLGLTPGLYSDFEGNHRDAFRLGARSLVAMTYSPTVQLVAGVAYLDRDDVEFLPLGGLVWTPRDDIRLELVSPRPRYLQRLWKEGGQEAWWYIAGELGGGSWAIERRCGCSDTVNYYDGRLTLGWELRNERGLGGLFEAGYVFYRHLEYLSGGPTFEPDDTFVIRAGLTF